MKLLVILLCLLSERFLIHSLSYHRFDWFESYYKYINNFTSKNNFPKNTAFQLFLIIMPILIVVGLVYLILSPLLFGLLGLLFNIVLFYYCLGPKNPFYPMTNEDNAEQQNPSLYFSEVNNQLFSVIFWYVVAGPLAALLFRLVSLGRKIDSVSLLAKDLTELLEWIPARLTVLLYLLVGNFQSGLKRFSDYFIAKPEFNEQMLSDCGLLAVGGNDLDEVPMPVAETLVEHAVTVLLVFIALFTLAAWL